MTAQQFGGNVIDVAAAVVLKRDAEFLLTQRPAGRPYAGYWEFPGGKLLPGEAPEEAVRRELKEELDIDVVEARRWITRYYEYPHANVRLHFFRIGRWEGDVRALEGQAFAWQRATQTTVGPMLPANAPVLRALALPSIYAISNAQQIGIDPFLARMKAAFERGLRLIQIREKEMHRAEVRELTVRALDLAASYRA
jgi:8-oxo-dGTP diphosphatase